MTSDLERRGLSCTKLIEMGSERARGAVVFLLVLGACGGPEVPRPREDVHEVSLTPKDRPRESEPGPPIVELREVERIAFDPAGGAWLFADGKLFRSADGKLFEDVTPKGFSCGTPPVTPCDAHFGLSRRTVWLAGPPDGANALPIYYLRDGGGSWQTRRVPDLAIPVGLTFVDRTPTLTVVARPHLTLANPLEGTVTIRSIDDGKEWKIVARTKETGPVVEAGEKLFFASSTPKKTAGVATKLLVSTLSAPAWKEAKLGPDDVVSFVPRFAADGQKGILCTDTEKEVRLWQTTDGGAKWNLIQKDTEAGACDDWMLTSRGACFAARGSKQGGTFLCTRDFGDHFEKVQAFEGAEILAFTDSETLAAWGFARGEILRMKIGGTLEHWFPRRK